MEYYGVALKNLQNEKQVSSSNSTTVGGKKRATRVTRKSLHKYKHKKNKKNQTRKHRLSHLARFF